MAGAKGAGSSAEHRQLLAAFVRDHEGEILASWIESVRQRPGATHVPDSALIAHVSPLLHWLGDEHGAPRGMDDLERVAGELASARMVEGTAEEEVVAEWSLLRDSLVRSAGAELEAEESPAVTTFVHRAVDTCLMAAVERSTRAHDRALGAVESVSKANFESASLDELLQRLLQTFKQAAPEVDVAAIALSDGRACACMR
jgi:hypothetical protein